MTTGLKFSTSARTGMLGGALHSLSFKAMFTGGSLLIYSGPVPASADDALSGNTELLEIDASGAGLTFENAVDGYIEKTAAEAWSGTVTNVPNYAATFFRFAGPNAVAAVEDAAVDLSDTYHRFQGTVDVADADMTFGVTTWANGSTKGVEFFRVYLPTYA